MCTEVGIGAGPARDTIKAISLAESQGFSDMYGDVHLQDEKWGPSVGLHQIRTLKADSGKGSDRDIERVLNPLENLRAAWNISKKGTDFTPWSVFNSGSYMAFMPGKPSYKADCIVDFGPWENYRRSQMILEQLEVLVSGQDGLFSAINHLPEEMISDIKERLVLTKTSVLQFT